jgi:putative hydrolase of the HAD superfamily
MPVPHPPTLRAVFFDAGNTLLRMNYEAIAEQLAVQGVRVGVAAVEQAEWRARVRLDDEVLAPRAPGLSTESGSTADHYLRALLRGLGVTDERVVQAVSAWRRAYNPPIGVWGTIAPRAAAALERARAAGLRTAVISNSNGSVRAILEGLGLGAGLDFVLDSAEVGVEKPDPRIFQLALERARVQPAEAAYVGDLYSVDVLGARAAGLAAILLDPGAHWGPRDCPTAPDVLAAVDLLLHDHRRSTGAG